MRIAISIISLIILSFIQISFLPNFVILSSMPNLILIVLVAWCIAGNYKEALFWGIAGGIILDLFSPFYFGTIALSNLAVIITLYFITQNFINNDDQISIAVICAFATIAYNFFLVFFTFVIKLLRMHDIIQPISLGYIISIFIATIFNVCILLVCYKHIKSIHDLQNYYEQRRHIKA